MVRFVSKAELIEGFSHECELPLIPGIAFIAFEKGFALATPDELWQLIHKLAFPFTPVIIPPEEL